MVAKLRFFNCTVCAYLILFHFLPLVINPIRLALLLKSPARLVLEVLVGIISISLFTTEAQVPIVAEKILYLFRKCRVGNIQLVDLDVARGRVVAITVMTMAIGMVNHLNSHPASTSHNTVVSSDPTTMDENAQQSIIVNGTNSSAATLNETTTSTGIYVVTSYPGTPSYSDGNAALGFLFAIVYGHGMLLALLSYTIYVIVEYPSYAEYRAFPHVHDDSSRSSGAALSSASSRSWVSNIPDFSSITGRGGYQSVDNPIQMKV